MVFSLAADAFNNEKNWTDCVARLDIGGSIVSEFPSPELVINEMELMYLESESSDPPEIVLEYVNRQGLAEQLVMAIAFHSLMTPRWILYHSSRKQSGLLASWQLALLQSHAMNHGHAMVRFLCI